tara:strand:+ start:1473 stop:1703 length:231 start_codon:yes stop_codon:yes gene_type:complete
MDKNLSFNLKHLMFIRGYTKLYCSKELKISYPTFLGYLKNPTKMQLTTLITLCKLLDVSICDLFNGKVYALKDFNR